MITTQPSTSDSAHRTRTSTAPFAAAVLVLSGGECYPAHTGALNTVKWPDCAAD